MCSEEGKDGGKGTDIVRGGLGFLGGKVDVAAVVSNKDVIIRRPGRVINTPSLGVPWYEVDPLYHRIHL